MTATRSSARRAKPKVYGDTAVHTIIVDWDGTAVPAQWPDRPTAFMPGFEKAMRTFHKAGFRLTIQTARISPYDPWTGDRRDPSYSAAEIQYIRGMLDAAGLTFIDIWTREGKPGGSVYIDDKAERYGGHTKSWDAMTVRVMARLGKEDAVFPAMAGEE
jgi:hypothetical protein